MSWLALKPNSFQEFQERQRTVMIIIAAIYTFSIGLNIFVIFLALP
ncbi:MAG: hypothetical protein P1V18_02405 [Candidatus Gracilibacteria bacterium]|nr:hypothetical protein [Candidatus Gracilibacteria bacterium]